MDGLTFLRKLMHFHPIPAIIVSSVAQPSAHAALDALECGAVEVLAKPGGPYSVGDLRQMLAAKVRAAALARLQSPLPAERPPLADAPATRLPAVPAADTLIAIGASTGGTEAIAAILARLPAAAPPILITQHIPPVFSRAFANRLNNSCQLEVKEAEDGDVVRAGLALVAPGDRHMVLRRAAGRWFVSIKTGPRICYQRPSVDVLFHSVAEAAGSQAIGALLTGMGNDGAQGLLAMRRAGAHTIAQDEASCIVFGMPREAIHLQAAAEVLPLARIAAALLAPHAPQAAGGNFRYGRTSPPLL